ncbi:MAG: hypothetical protein Metus_0759 [Candidatus Methanosuratincola subterraneus]|uniref:Uncharacterized protein n=1 Tax=Methanosuratincola subterraneus TaxID=2593994 RepID=A0A3S3RDQ5_METS7|nr:MAG: hypothetical protein Metus_0759 [Candidatus Methanosuratincola subterraneus]
MANNIYPLKAEKFLNVALKHYEAILLLYISLTISDSDIRLIKQNILGVESNEK